MIRILTAIASVALATAAHAQQQSFEPYTINEGMQRDLFDYLYRQVPAAYADPIRRQMVEWQDQARQKRVMDERRKATAPEPTQ